LELKTLASEMISQAEAMPMTIERLMEGIASKSFPNVLKRTETIDGIGPVQVQYSHDHLGPGKYIKHLSFSREDLEYPSIETQKAFQEAFFENKKDVLELPSTLPYVIQMARLVIFDVSHN